MERAKVQVLDASADPGKGPSWESATLPEPPAFTPRNFLSMVGPGAILLAAAIGGGEWLMGPTAAIQYGTSIFGIATLAIILQIFFNLEATRYTLYTGEPIYGGIMRLSPGPAFWGPFYCVLALINLGWSALAASCAATLFSVFRGRIPADGDELAMYWLAILTVVVASSILAFGTTVERTLERASKIMVVFIFLFLFVANVIFVPWRHWLTTLVGFFQLNALGQKVDWMLLGALAASSGAGGISCLSISNLVRDKGFGMGARVGAIPAAFGKQVIGLSATGKVFALSSESLRNWKRWLQFVHVDQVLLWGTGAFLGMYLNVNLAVFVIPANSAVSGLAAGAYQAQYMASSLWSGFWFLALLNGFWILFSTQLANTDTVARTITDIVWLQTHWKNRSRVLNIRFLYFGILALYTVWGIIAVGLVPPLTLFKIMANLGAPVMILGGIHLLLVNRRFLPRALRPSLFRQFMILLCVLFYGFFFVCLIVPLF
jgi:Mn2+/Fe2+ NRAMP family transporter